MSLDKDSFKCKCILSQISLIDIDKKITANHNMVCKFLFLGLWAIAFILGYDCAPAPQTVGENGDAPNSGMGYGSPYGSFGFPYYGFNPYYGSFGPPGAPQGGPQGGAGGMPYGMNFSPFGRFGAYGAMGPGFGGPGPFFGPPAGKLPPGKTFGPPPHVFAGKYPFWTSPGYTGPQPGGPPQ